MDIRSLLFSNEETSKIEKAKNVVPNNKYDEFKEDEIYQSIVDRFEKIVKLYPDRAAIVFGEKSYTYDELDKKSNQVARYILNESNSSSEGVAFIYENSIETIVCILGIIKAGKAYIPLDPSYPLNRLSYMLEDSKAETIIFNGDNEGIADLLKDGLDRELQVINYNSIKKDISNEKVDANVSFESLAYILYTSGSTGKPKGVAQKHGYVMQLAYSLTNNIHLSKEDNVSLLGSYSFSASVLDIFGTLLNGGKLLPFNVRRSGFDALESWVKDENITILHLTPSLLRGFSSALKDKNSLNSVRVLYFGGELVSKKDWKIYKEYFKDDCLMLNSYGCTEFNIMRTYLINKDVDITTSTVPIGVEAPNVKLKLVDNDGNEVFRNQAGQIVIESKFLPNGYWNKPEISKERFKENPEEGTIIFNTGDNGRFLENGLLLHLGRDGEQVKIRGFRVELSDIESNLEEYKGIEKAVVKAFEGKNDDVSLCAFYTGKNEVDSTILHDFLAKLIPDYMMPDHFVKVDEFPKTPSGKIDRKSLKKPEANNIQNKEIIECENEMQKNILSICSEVLGVEAGMGDNFLSLGGHSLKVLSLISEVKKSFDVDVSVYTIINSKNIKEISDFIESEAAKKEKVSKQVKAAGAGNRKITLLNEKRDKNIVLFPSLMTVIGNYILYKNLAGKIDDYALHLLDFFECNNLIEEYVDIITENIKDRPLVLIGYSLGGSIAFETATELIKRGYEVSDLILVDSNIVNEKMSSLMTDKSLRRKYIEYYVDKEIEYSQMDKEVKDEVIEEFVKVTNGLEGFINSKDKIDCNIHLLKCDDNPELDYTLRGYWKDLSKKEYKEYRCYGVHNDVFKEEYVEKNSKIIKDILDKIYNK